MTKINFIREQKGKAIISMQNVDNRNKEDVWKYPAPFTLEEYQGSV